MSIKKEPFEGNSIIGPKRKCAKKVDFGKPVGHLDTQIFPNWDPVKKQREKNKKNKGVKNQ